GLAALLDLEREARDAATPAALAFVIVNRTRTVLRCDSAAAWSGGPAGPSIDAVAAVSTVDRDGPYAQWLRAEIRALAPLAVTATAGTWDQAPPWALWCPLPGQAAGFVLFRIEPWSDGERRIAERLAATYAHARAALDRHRWLPRLPWLRDRRAWAGTAALLVVLLALPVHQTAVAPATVVARSPLAVTAPVEGVIAEIAVAPYAAVEAGQVLVRFDATHARGRLQLARNAERVAAADLLKTRQRAFSDADANARLSSVSAQLDLHRNEAAQAEDLLERTLIHADRPGLALFDDPQDWTGRPVAVGERIMTLADPAAVMLHVSLPAEDAFVLEPGAAVRFALNIDPLHSLDATVAHVAYEAAVGPEGFLAYRLTAHFAADEAPPRIGLKGIATVTGARVALGRFLVRRPLAALRRQLRL
ncbi:MAG: HlyD family efflux transporter periplasmic adaptor subunit, partial [Magnetospirillum sp.]|nr:HlyD family efflux transporter periplasmic adaptor subunit [Magnetospirillum sp.]